MLQADGLKSTVLVTGAAGKIGRHVVRELLQAGYKVRALTTRPIADVHAVEDLEWHTLDFTQSLEFSALVEGCVGVVHLAAEISDPRRMHRVNVEATGAVARAAAENGVDTFCYVSSAAVYGSSRKQLVTENSPTINAAEEVKGQHWAPPAVRQYARTKLLGEQLVAEAIDEMSVVIVRPTVVVDVADVFKLAARSPLRQLLVGRRHAHHVYVRDVAAAIVWLTCHHLKLCLSDGSYSIYNITQDDFAIKSYYDIATHLRSTTPYGPLPVMPSIVDQAIEFLRYGSLPWRFSLGQMVFSGERLAREGFELPYGLEFLYSQIKASAGTAEEHVDLIEGDTTGQNS